MFARHDIFTIVFKVFTRLKENFILISKVRVRVAKLNSFLINIDTSVVIWADLDITNFNTDKVFHDCTLPEFDRNKRAITVLDNRLEPWIRFHFRQRTPCEIIRNIKRGHDFHSLHFF